MIRWLEQIKISLQKDFFESVPLSAYNRKVEGKTFQDEDWQNWVNLRISFPTSFEFNKNEYLEGIELDIECMSTDTSDSLTLERILGVVFDWVEKSFLIRSYGEPTVVDLGWLHRTTDAVRVTHFSNTKSVPTKRAIVAASYYLHLTRS